MNVHPQPFLEVALDECGLRLADLLRVALEPVRGLGPYLNDTGFRLFLGSLGSTCIVWRC